LKAALEKKYGGIEVELIESGGGVFEVEHQGNLIFSKKRKGRFPDEEEIFSALA
jgi:selT/selW/selH-like putative selenoprotein